MSDVEALKAENKKLFEALAAVMPWVGHNADGPVWATPDAKVRNKQMCDAALDQAWDCFPENYGQAQTVNASNN